MKAQTFTQAMTELRHDVAGRYPSSPTMQRHDAECAMRRADPVLAALLRMEALGDLRCENNVDGMSKLTTVRDLAREAIVAHTGKPFANPLYPERTR